jgi:molybdopterin-guanine dinucleotide biosynthesis protein A
MEATGIILAGGESKRMGREKGLVLYKGKPLIQYSIDILKGNCSQILISSNTKSYEFTGYPLVPDEVKGIGPVGGIHACLKASKTDHNIILACDMPFISDAYLQFLIDHHSDSMVAVPWFGKDKYEPVSAYYHKDFSDVLAAYISLGNYKLPEIFNKTPVKKLSVEGQDFYHEKLFYNINSIEDLTNINQ